MVHRFVFFLSIYLVFSLFPGDCIYIIRDQLGKAQKGDYMVTANQKVYTLFLIAEKKDSFLRIEEITVPQMGLPKGAINWKGWVQQGAPSHTSWITYVIFPDQQDISRFYSYSLNSWVSIPQEENALLTLLSLNFSKVSDRDRKRVGPPHGNSRPYWQPKMILEGTYIPSVAFDAWSTVWPRDRSPLSGKKIEVYFPVEIDLYPSYFPYWLEVLGTAGKGKIRVIDTGNHLISSQQAPQFF